jgi:hypothetical protein
MDVLELIIENLQKEELRYFDLFASRQGESENRKDLQLLKLIRKNPTKPDEIFRTQLGYDTIGTNAWYRLRNRLQEDLIESLHVQHIDSDEFSRILKYLCVARILAGRNAFKLAYNILRKAEKSAEKAELFSLLELIYTELIRLSQKSLFTDPEPYILKRKENQKKLEQINRIDEVLAALNYRLVKNQRFAKEGKGGLKVLENLLKEQRSDSALLNSPSFQIRIYQMMSRLLLQRKEFKDLESYLVKTYYSFNQAGIFTKNRHDLKLEMLTWILNTLYSNGKFSQAIKEADTLYQAMQEYQSQAYEKYLLFYCNTLVINHVGLKQYPEGIRLIENLLSDKKQNLSEHYRMMISVNLMYLYFLTKDLRKALRVLHKISLMDAYRTAPILLKLKLDIAGLILHFEAGNTGWVEERAEKMQKEYGKSKDIPKDDIEFVKIMQELPGQIIPVKNTTVRKKITQLIQSPSDSEDIIDYREWLGGKI